jgi:RimJ/RimL family protein N-acetyltransferase
MLAWPLADGAELRPLEPWQAAEFAACIDRARDHLAPWLPFARMITDADTAREWLQRYADEQARDGGRVYGIWLDDVLVGGVLFRVFDTRVGTCELGVWLAPQAQGRGLVTRAAHRLIDWAVGIRGMVRVEWRAVPDNVRSIAVAKRLGMTREGVLRQAGLPIDGVHEDIEVWSLLADEWQRGKADGGDA